VWTPPISEELQAELEAALARPGASWVTPPRPVALTTDEPEAKATGWLYGRLRLDDGSWLGLAALFRGRYFEGADLGWHRAEELRTLG
jgi:hypothetical protein